MSSIRDPAVVLRATKSKDCRFEVDIARGVATQVNMVMANDVYVRSLGTSVGFRHDIANATEITTRRALRHG